MFIKNKKLLTQNDLDLLQKTGAITEYRDFDFLNSIKMIENRYRAIHQILDLTICISESCNFHCKYCYEKAFNKNKIISYKVIDKLIDYLKLQQEHFSFINVTIYGGEPLLSLEKITYLHKKLLELNKETSYTIITNGYLLSLEVFKVLTQLSINRFQVTLDGFKNTHNKKRPHKRKSDSYEKITKNLDEIYNFCISNNQKISINIRVNIDKTNKDSFVNFYKYIHNKYNNFFFVNSAFIENLDNKKDKSILSKKERIKFCLNNFSNNIYEPRFLPRTSVRMNYCCATFTKSLVLDTSGNVFKCWNDIGNNKKIIFNINSPRNKNNFLESMYYIFSDPIYDKKCSKCFLLLSCFGGCPQIKADTKKRACELAKHKPKEFLETLYLRRNAL